jgi:FkbM family methyltransferase
MTDKVGKFNYSGKFWDRYTAFFDACKLLPKNANVLIVGANDGKIADPTKHIWKKTWNGWFIEPHPTIQPDHGHVIKAAVTDYVGTLQLYTMSDEAAESYKRIGAHGSCLTSFNREHIETRLRKNMSSTYAKLGNSAIVEIEVPCAPIKTLVPDVHFDLIQIDVEGMEDLIVPQALDLRPMIILYEHQHLNNDSLAEKAKKQGYTVTRLKTDTLLVL